jgi:hypothetical protein
MLLLLVDVRMKIRVIITLLTESHGGMTHDLMISLGRGFAPHSEGLTSSLFCLHEITVTR